LVGNLANVFGVPLGDFDPSKMDKVSMDKVAGKVSKPGGPASEWRMTGEVGGAEGAGGMTSPDLIEAANKIKEASEIFPKEIQMTIGDTSVNVNVNGAEVLNAIMPEVKSVVMNSVVSELISFEQTKDQNNSPGSYANNKKAEQYTV
jgi:hypothetical protein